MKLTDIRNSQGRLICRVDEGSKIVEIAVKGCITTIHFSDDGKINISNTSKAA